MPRDGTGRYTRTNGSFQGASVWTSQANSADKNINAGRHDTHDQDIADALTASVARDGQSPMTANLPLGSNRIIDVADGTATTDATTLGQLNGSFLGRKSVLQFSGAVGNGTNDDTVGIQAAIDDAAAAGGGDVFFPVPSAFWRTTATINVKRGVRLIFAGRNERSLLVNYIRPDAGVTVAVKADELKGCSIDGLGVDMVNMADGSVGVDIRSCWFGDFRNINVRNLTGANSIGYRVYSEVAASQGMYLTDHTAITVESTTGLGTGMAFRGQTGTPKRLTTQTLKNCSVVGMGLGFDFKDFGSGMVGINVNSESNTTDGLRANDTTNGNRLTLIGGEIANNAGWGLTGAAPIHAISMQDGGNDTGGGTGNSDSNVTLQWGSDLPQDATRPVVPFWRAQYAQGNTETVTLGATDSITPSTHHKRVQSTGGAVTLTSNPQIANPVNNRTQEIKLFGGSGTDVVTFVAGNGLRLPNGNMVLGFERCLTLSFDPTFGDWVEVSRT